MKVGNFKLELMVRSFLYQCNTIPNLAHAMAVLAKFIEESLASWDWYSKVWHRAWPLQKVDQTLLFSLGWRSKILKAYFWILFAAEVQIIFRTATSRRTPHCLQQSGVQNGMVCRMGCSVTKKAPNQNQDADYGADKSIASGHWISMGGSSMQYPTQTKLIKFEADENWILIRSLLYQCNTSPNLAYAMAVLAKFIVCS